ncbi:MAG: GTPase HflX [Candidatus Melainabacteria bacterium]|nr:GTPase HflX [Candidatus Melainabacteria bacterium]
MHSHVFDCIGCRGYTPISTLYGRLDGLKPRDLARLEKLYRRKLPLGCLCSTTLAEELCELSQQIGRPVSVQMDEKGRVMAVAVAGLDALHQVRNLSLPSPEATPTPGAVPKSADHYWIGTQTGWNATLTGACVTLMQFGFPVLVSLVAGVEEGFSQKRGEHTQYCDGAFVLTPAAAQTHQQRNSQTSEAMLARQLEAENRNELMEEGRNQIQFGWRPRPGQQKPKTLLLGVHPSGKQALAEAKETLAELIQLVTAMDCTPVEPPVFQARPKPDPKYYLGRGKAEEVALWIQQHGIAQVVCDDELTPNQQRNLEGLLRVLVLDRTEVILHIFAQRAQSHEGRLQVELAQLQYQLPRLAGRGSTMSQQVGTAASAGGKAAARGPGETQLEQDRRALRRRLDQLEVAVTQVSQNRTIQRRQREESALPVIALVGYTNAGKSTLMQKLSGANVLVEDQLFATLDTTARRVWLNAEQAFILTDTVGFIQKLPTGLVKAFRATLEETARADLILHVWDVSHPQRRRHLQTVEDTLAKLDALSVPRWTLCNKVDQCPDWQEELAEQQANLSLVEPFSLSALTGKGLPELKERLESFVSQLSPNSNHNASPSIHPAAEVALD